MARWLAQLTGDQFDIEDYPTWFPSGDVHAVRDEKGVYLAGERFELLGDAALIREEAGAVLRRMFAVGSLVHPNLAIPLIGAVYREHGDGRRDAFVSLRGVVMRAKPGAFTVLMSGQPATLPATTQAQDRLTAAAFSPHLTEALDLWGKQGRTWTDLYKVLEAIEAHLGKQVNDAGLCTSKERTRFARTAQHPKTAGLDSRHALGKSQSPPADPMSLGEAERFIRRLLDMVLR